VPGRAPAGPRRSPAESERRSWVAHPSTLRVLLIDNYDSFVHNLARYVRELGARTSVVRNDAVDVEAIAREAPTHVILSPGPCTPNEAGVSNEVIAELGETTPILGVCLGHQCIGAVYGGLVTRSPRPMHGKTSLVFHEGSEIFEGVPSPFAAARYHSLVVDPQSVPPELEILATTADGDVMALAHRNHPVVGVQFHPESVLTEHGYRILANFLGCELPEPEPSAR
jgi:anthranilate synthase/aminodeoxychorismate synthase-like glutamine amidotransferase